MLDRKLLKQIDWITIILVLTLVVIGLVSIASIMASPFSGDEASLSDYLEKLNLNYVKRQAVNFLVGVAAFLIVIIFDYSFFKLVIKYAYVANVALLLVLFTVEKTRGISGWFVFEAIDRAIQPAELCKIPFILILAKIMSVKQNKLSAPTTILQIGGVTIFLFVLIVAASEDLGVALQYIFIFVIMAFVGGVNFVWFLGALGALAAAAPTIWTHLSDDRRNRILVLFDASIDPDAQNERYQVNRSIRALQNGGIRGQGLYNGTMVQSSSLPMQRNDFIFSAIGEELGMLGCLAVLLLLSAVIIRIIHVGIKSGNYMNRLICVGIAGMMASQILINVGVCLGLVPVIGLTLPFFSYGGSSLITTFLAMGIVSGINMRPAPDVHARYIRPKS